MGVNFPTPGIKLTARDARIRLPFFLGLAGIASTLGFAPMPPPKSGLGMTEALAPGDFPTETVTGLPRTVRLDLLPHRAGQASDADHHANTIDFAPEIIMEPGTFMTEGYDVRGDSSFDYDNATKALRSGAARHLHNPDFHRVLTGEPYPLPVQKGETDMITGAFMHLEFPGPNGPVALDLPGMKGHNWMVIVKNSEDDPRPDEDNSFDIMVTNYHGGSTTALRYPRGWGISENNVKQNLAAAHTVNGGGRGVTKVSVIAIDAKYGTMSRVHQTGRDAAFQDKVTNLV